MVLRLWPGPFLQNLGQALPIVGDESYQGIPTTCKASHMYLVWREGLDVSLASLAGNNMVAASAFFWMIKNGLLCVNLFLSPWGEITIF